MTDELITKVDAGVAWVIFNRPAARNAVTQTMLAAMREFLDGVAGDADVRCVVLTGAGDHFMAGGDVKGFQAALEKPAETRRAEFEARVRTTSPLFLRLESMPQPVVAKVRGAVAGAALGFVAGADFAVCSESSIFVLSHVNIGASPDGASSYHLPRVVGVRKAKEIAILGQRMDAKEALACGLVTRVVPDAELDNAVGDLVARIVKAPATSVQRAKRLMDRSPGHTLAQQLELEAQSFGACAATDDFIEGVSAFAGKRPAEFNKKKS